MNVEVTGIASKVREFFPTVAKAPLSGPDGMKTSYFGLFRMDTGVSVGAGSVSGRSASWPGRRGPAERGDVGSIGGLWLVGRLETPLAGWALANARGGGWREWPNAVRE
jgi:hypothetical protein